MTTREQATEAIRRVTTHAGVGIEAGEVAFRTEIGGTVGREFTWEVRCVVVVKDPARPRAKPTRHTACGYSDAIPYAAQMCCDEIDRWRAFENRS